MSETNNRENEIGALWVRKMKQGDGKYLSGTLKFNNESVKVVVFKNNFKGDNESAPDWRVYKSTLTGEAKKTTAPVTPAKAKVKAKPAPEPEPVEQPDDEPALI